jgi:hypothetical protein
VPKPSRRPRNGLLPAVHSRRNPKPAITNPRTEEKHARVPSHPTPGIDQGSTDTSMASQPRMVPRQPLFCYSNNRSSSACRRSASSASRSSLALTEGTGFECTEPFGPSRITSPHQE